MHAKHDRRKAFIFSFVGLGSLIWFLSRVIAKPSRINYPCMRAAAPIASTFLLWVFGSLTSLLFFRRARRYFRESRYIVAAGCVATAAICGAIFFSSPARPPLAATLATPNSPVGTAKGTNPGRVVWTHDSKSTNWAGVGDGHLWETTHADQATVDKMMSQTIQSLTGKTTDAAAWTVLFQYYNSTHGRGNVGYTAGEKIAIKVNMVGCIYSEGNVSTSTYSLVNKIDYMNTSPMMMMALFRQLVNVAGVAQSDIAIGDPICLFPNEYYNYVHAEFPNIKYMDFQGTSGRTKVTTSSVPMYFSSRPTGVTQDYIPQHYVDATYLINFSNFKSHSMAGFTGAAKNHFGSLYRLPGQSGYYDLHQSLPVNQSGAGKYRVLVDLLGHAQLGGKTMLNLCDGLYSGAHPDDLSPRKWITAPFYNDWTSSLFASQDPVAMECVMFDLMQLDGDSRKYPQMAGVEDYLIEAARADNPPSGTFYDPNHSSNTTRLSSLGVCEHWNNATARQYSRNLNPATGTGIELVFIDNDAVTDVARGKTVTASSNENTTNVPANAVDGNATTRWSSLFADPQWIRVDLGAITTINRVVLYWEAASAKNYTIDVSADGSSWTTVSTKTNMATGARTDDISDLNASGRYIRMNGTARTSAYGYSLWSFEVYGKSTPVSGTLAFSNATYSVAENGGSALITVNRSGGSSGSVTVNYASSNGTASAGSDYTAVSGTLTFASGVASQTFSVPIIDDAVAESNETVNLTLSNATGGATLDQSSAVLTIVDNDGVAGVTLPGRIQAEDYKTGGEGVGYHDLTTGNSGNVYRTDNVDIEATSDVGGGYDVGWTSAGEWLAYDVNVTATGAYDLTARMACGATGTKTMTVTLDGTAIAAFTTTDASGWQVWKDVQVKGVNLTAGAHALRMNMTTAGFNLNYLDVASSVPTPAEIGQGKTALASSEETNNGTLLKAGFANDGNTTTRWSSAFSDPQWLRIDLGSTYSISQATLAWEAASAKSYTIDVSTDGTTWATIATKMNMASGARTDDITGLSGTGRYIRMNGTARTTTYGYSIYEFKVYGVLSGGAPPPPATDISLRNSQAPGIYALGIANVNGNSVSLTLPGSGTFRLSVYSMSGVLVKDLRKAGTIGPNPVLLGLPAGMYLLRLGTSLGRVEKLVRVME